MNEPKSKETGHAGAKVEHLEFAAPEPGQPLTPEWQAEFLTNLRLAKARIPHRFAGKTFDNFVVGRNAKRRDILEAAKSFVHAFSGKTTDGLLVSGNVGCGKTHIAVAILQAIIRKGHTGLYYNMPDLLSDIRATFSEDAPMTESDLLEEINEPDLLALDDLGAETAKDWVNDRLYLIVNRRYESSRPILVTTNLDMDELTRKLGERTVSRLCEMCHSFAPFPDEDYRKKHMR